MKLHPLDVLSDIDAELSRTKMFINASEYSNGTAINHIVRQYRTALKQYRKIVQDDVNDLVKTY